MAYCVQMSFGLNCFSGVLFPVFLPFRLFVCLLRFFCLFLFLFGFFFPKSIQVEFAQNVSYDFIFSFHFILFYFILFYLHLFSYRNVKPDLLQQLASSLFWYFQIIYLHIIGFNLMVFTSDFKIYILLRDRRKMIILLK